MAATVERARAQKYLRAAHIASNEARACCNELLNIDMNLLARSRDMIANAGRRLTQKQENRPPRLYPIDRKMLERHLQQAEAHVAKGGQHIIQQRELVARLEGRGHDASRARTLLEQFEEMQEIHISHRDRLLRRA